jgi:hypothetical protein
MYLALPLAALAAGFLASGFGNPPIVPLSIEYANSDEENSVAKICELIITLTNAGPPQQVTVSVFAGYDKLEAAIAVGFMAGAAKQSPAGNHQIDVTSAALI